MAYLLKLKSCTSSLKQRNRVTESFTKSFREKEKIRNYDVPGVMFVVSSQLEPSDASQEERCGSLRLNL